MLAHASASKVYDKEFRGRQGGHISITLNGDWAEPWNDDEECEW
jgi:beta-glucosidase